MDRHDAVISSLEQLAERHGDPRELVYAQLFALRPEFQDLFVMDTDGGVRGAMLDSALNCVIALAEGDEASARLQLEAAALAHDGYGLAPGEINLLFECLCNVGRDRLGPDWTVEIDDEWTSLLRTLAELSS